MISKTLFTTSRQCLKLAHRINHSPKSLAKDSLGIQFRKQQGMNVGNLAKQLFSKGLDLSNKPDEEKLTLTSQNKTTILFEASALAEDNLFARADILIPKEDNIFTIIEVKADTKIKPEHIEDVFFQYYVFKKAGYNITKVKIAHPNNEYIREENINPEEFFTIEDVTEQIIDVEQNIELLKQTLKHQEPEPPIGPYCDKPFPCPLKKECWSFLPKNNVTQLYFDKKIGFELLKQGIQEIKDIKSLEPKGRGKSEREIQLKATKTNKIHIQKEDIKNWLDQLQYPIYYFDFETYAPAIPLFNNSRPWQRIPFQYSVHIEEKDNTITHKEFLATTTNDPRPQLIKALKEHLKTTGSIVVYNQAFEKSVIKELIRDFPDFEDAGNNILSRIVDLAHPFQKFHYYNPEQQGKYSIKVILPLFTKLNYKELKIKNGEEAFCAFEDILKGNLNKTKALKEYCKLDTLAEVEIVKKLKVLVEKSN